MSLKAETPSLDRPTDSAPTPREIDKLSKKHAGAIASLALVDIMSGLIQNPTDEQRAILQEGRERITKKLEHTDAAAVMAGISLDQFAGDEDKAVSTLLTGIDMAVRYDQSPDQSE